MGPGIDVSRRDFKDVSIGYIYAMNGLVGALKE
jgi:hypothetical protein